MEPRAIAEVAELGALLEHKVHNVVPNPRLSRCTSPLVGHHGSEFLGNSAPLSSLFACVLSLTAYQDGCRQYARVVTL